MSRIIDEEIYRMQMTAISTITLANTPESYRLAKIEKGHPYWTPAYEDVCATVEREIFLRAELGKRKISDDPREEKP